MEATYIRFVEQRHTAWVNRMSGLPRPWCADRIVRTRKFTNVFRVIDWGSQFLLKALLLPEESPSEQVMRCYLYRWTNRPETWMEFRALMGRYPLIRDLHDGTLGNVWLSLRDSGEQVFSGAYVILPRPGQAGDKMAHVIANARELFPLGADTWRAEVIRGTTEQRYNLLRKATSVGPFMAMQIATDIGYALGGDENSFVVAGPGAIRGAAHAYPGMKPLAAIKHAQPIIHELLPHVHVQGHKPSLMDIQNTFCEFSKYVRYLRGGGPGKVEYQAAHTSAQLQPVLPNHWSKQ